jgi:hypothetical protein
MKGRLLRGVLEVYIIVWEISQGTEGRADVFPTPL